MRLDAFGLVSGSYTYRITSNPFRANYSYNAGSEATMGWTRSKSDVSGRVVEVQSFSGSSLPAPWGSNASSTGAVTTGYDAQFTTVTDQAGKVRRSMTNGLAQLARVDEPNASGSLGTTASPAQPTSYTYDQLSNLTQVSQGSQTRTFVYSSLARLTSAANPESGTVTYTYDNNGNLLTKRDARSITTTFTYDALNRPTLKNYSDTTADVAYFYDSQTLPSGAPSFNRGYAKGRLVGVTYGSGSSAGTYRGYDALGRVVRQYQRTDSVNYLTDATYNKAGAMLTETYPAVPGASGRRTVSYTFDTAGRLSALASAATTYAPAASVSSISYAAHGGLATETLGNTLIHAQVYNNRLQPTTIKLGTAALPTSVMNLTYNYGTTTNNGNVQSVTYAGGGLSYTQTFGYDSLNRLTTSVENSSSSWSQTNSYDRYGNRSIVGGGLAFNATNNRITSAGYTYDSAGNLTNDGSHSYTFDAENKISKVDAVSAYTYDGEGQRVRKLVGENLRFIYGIGGQLVAEFDGSNGNLKKEYVQGGATLITIEPTALNPNGTRYTTSDHLGSPRVVTSSSATVVSRHDYMPFGVEISVGVGGRTTGMGYGAADGLRQKFTQKERDIETGLDYFNSRYYASSPGRFTSADSFQGFTHNPQTLNLYAYVQNNPLKFVDPTGHWAIDGIMTTDVGFVGRLMMYDLLGMEPPSPQIEQVGQEQKPQNPAPGSFEACVGGLGGTGFTQEAADLINQISGDEGTSRDLLAVTWKNENGFDLRPGPNKNDRPDNIQKWDVGPFHINIGYTLGAVSPKGVNFKGLTVEGVFGYTFYRSDGKTPTTTFDGVPLENGRMAARRLNFLGSNDRERVVNYAGRKNGPARGRDYDANHGAFADFFNCYKGR